MDEQQVRWSTTCVLLLRLARGDVSWISTGLHPSRRWTARSMFAGESSPFCLRPMTQARPAPTGAAGLGARRISDAQRGLSAGSPRTWAGKPSTWDNGCRCVQERPNRPNCAGCWTYWTHWTGWTLSKCCHGVTGSVAARSWRLSIAGRVSALCRHSLRWWRGLVDLVGADRRAVLGWPVAGEDAGDPSVGARGAWCEQSRPALAPERLADVLVGRPRYPPGARWR